MAEQIINQDSVEKYIKDMATYSIAVIRRRALADIRDGLKPVQRRILYDIYKYMGNGFHKSQKVVGSVIGTLHPHGDQSCYSAFDRIISTTLCKVPLLEGQGDFIGASGDKSSAARYTEVKLSRFSNEVIFADMNTDAHVVDYSPNFDRSIVEPDYLPVSIPLLLLNGTSGIAIGVSSNIPVHNLSEVVDVTRKLLKNPNLDFVLVPDQCQPTEIINADWKKLNNSGGTFRVRGLMEEGEFRGYPALFIKSLPDGVFSQDVKNNIEDLAVSKQVPMIKNCIDATKISVNIIVQLEKGADINFVKQILYKKAGVEKSQLVNFEVINDLECKYMSYKEYLLKWIEYRKITKFRQHSLKLRNIATRMHILSTYISAMESGEIDNIIALIRRQKKVDKDAITEYIISKCKMTKIQAEYLLSTDIRHLASGYLPGYKQEYDELEKERKFTESFILNHNKIIEEIDTELATIAKKYASPRLAKIIRVSDETNIPKGTFKIAITQNNFIKKLSLDDRVNAIKGDQIKFIVKVENTDSLILFDNKGRVFKLPVHKIPVCDKGAIGNDIKYLIRNCTADIAAVLTDDQLKSIRSFNGKHFITTVTACNYIKNMDIEDFANIPLSGMYYTKMTDSKDEVKDVIISPYNFDVIIYSGHKALRTPIKDIPVYKRASQGVLAMNTTDTISGLSLVYPDATHVVIVTQSGKFNKFDIGGLQSQSRNKAGNKVINLGKTDRIIAIYGVNDNNVLSVVTQSGRVYVNVKDIKQSSSVAAGVKMIEGSPGNVVRVDVELIQGGR